MRRSDSGAGSHWHCHGDDDLSGPPPGRAGPGIRISLGPVFGARRPGAAPWRLRRAARVTVTVPDTVPRLARAESRSEFEFRVGPGRVT